jgi:hypothetical protein
MVDVKPYVEMKDYDDSIPDEVVSHDFWEAMSNREQSTITELFYGQYKSKVSCVGCGGNSVKADAFASLSLDIPPIKRDYLVRVVRMGSGNVASDRIEVGMSLAVGATLENVGRDLELILGIDEGGLRPFIVQHGHIQTETDLEDETFIRTAQWVVLYVFSCFNFV